MSHKRYKHIGNPAIRLIEECAELIKAISKAERFGIYNRHPLAGSKDNLYNIKAEFEDVKEAFEDYMIHLNKMSEAEKRKVEKQTAERYPGMRVVWTDEEATK